MTNITISNIEISPAIYIPVIYLLWVSVLLAVKAIVFGRLKVFAQKTTNKIDDMIFHSLDLPVVLLIFVSGVFMLEKVFSFGAESELLRAVVLISRATTIVAIVMFLDRVVNFFIDTYAPKVALIKSAPGVMRTIIRSVVLGLGILIILDNFGVSIAPLLASLGIGSLAVALALQPTLENFFSGLQVIVDKPIAVGQFIKLETGEEGYVHKVGWRSTWVRMLPNNMVVIPNRVIVNSKIINYYYPETEMSTLVQVGVHYDSDLEHVEKVTIEVAKEVLSRVQGATKTFEPFIRFHTFNDFSVDYTVILRVNEFVDNYMVRHEFVKALHKRFKQEGIVIPYPIRTIDWNPGSDPMKVDGK